MNYSKIYEEIIENRKNKEYNGYTESHHIIPRSLGGSDKKENLVDLSAREHFICHLLLTKMYDKNSYEWHKMVRAFSMMSVSSSNQKRYMTSKLYKQHRKDFSDSMKLSQTGSGNSQYGTRWIYNQNLKRNRKIGKFELLPKDWKEGRVINFNKLKAKKKESKRIMNIDVRKMKKLKSVNEALELWNRFNTGNYKSIRDFSKDCDISHVAITKKWKTYIPHLYDTQKGKSLPSANHKNENVVTIEKTNRKIVVTVQ